MSETALREAIVRYGASMFARGLTFGSSGNISARLDDGWLMTPTSVALDRLDPAKLSKLDDGGRKLIEELWVDRRGARYFFIVARASKSGTADFNRALSHKRANSVLFDISDKFKAQEPDLDKQVGMLWLGNEFAQLGQEYCQWNVSRDPKKCTAEAINRSAFVSWVDCRL